MTVVWGKLKFYPSRKGEEVYLEEADLLSIFRQYDGKEIYVTIQEMGLDSNYQSSNQKVIK